MSPGSENPEVSLRASVPVQEIGWRTRLLGWLLASSLKLLCRTWRKTHEGFASVDEKRAQGHKMMLCFWHGKYVPIFAVCRWLWIERRNETACVFTSLSARGAVISEICRHFGLDCIQIPDLGRKRSFDLMRQALARHSAGVIAVDGPLGPRGRVKQGAVRLASELGYLLVPASVWAVGRWVAAKRWDRMEFPYPFTVIGLSMGEPVEVPAELDRHGSRQVMDWLADSLDHLEDRAHRLVE